MAVPESRRAEGANAFAARHLAGGHAQGVRLLDVDPDLGSALAGEELDQAHRQTVFPLLERDVGPFQPDELREEPGVRGHLHGFLVVSGSLAVNLAMSGRMCTRLVGPRELILLEGLRSDSIPISWEWSVLTPVRLALIDEFLSIVASRWPPLLGTILERAARQTRNAFLQQAISQLPRVEERLLALFWSIADRQGIVRPDGVWVEFAVTHDTLARMVGAQRPTVSLGLTRLADAGLLRSGDGGWLIARASLDTLG